MNDGTFGTTGELEGARRPSWSRRSRTTASQPLESLYWRNARARLRARSTRCWPASRRRRPSWDLKRAREADDQTRAGGARCAEDEVVERCRDTAGTVRLLWDVCQIPDFRKIMADEHTRLLGQLFGASGRADGGRLPRRLGGGARSSASTAPTATSTR